MGFHDCLFLFCVDIECCFGVLMIVGEDGENVNGNHLDRVLAR